MGSPSILGDRGFTVTRVFPLATSTAAYYAKTSGTSTGTKATTSRSIDLSFLPHQGATGGKPLRASAKPGPGAVQVGGAVDPAQADVPDLRPELLRHRVPVASVGGRRRRLHLADPGGGQDGPVEDGHRHRRRVPRRVRHRGQRAG